MASVLGPTFGKFYMCNLENKIFNSLKNKTKKKCIDTNKNVKLTIYYNKFKTSNLVVSNNSSPSTDKITW